jgi:hypothetical protein
MIPAEVAHRQHHNAQDRAAPDEADLAEARTEIVDLLISGNTLNGWTLAAVLDCESNENQKFPSELAEVLNLYSESACGASLWLRVLDYLQKIAVKHLPDEIVQEFAEENVRDA